MCITGRHSQMMPAAQQNSTHVQREGHTVEDTDVLSLGLGEAIVSLKNEAPFLFKMPKYT